jgi:hypothetical protein
MALVHGRHADTTDDGPWARVQALARGRQTPTLTVPVRRRRSSAQCLSMSFQFPLRASLLLLAPLPEGGTPDLPQPVMFAIIIVVVGGMFLAFVVAVVLMVAPFRPPLSEVRPGMQRPRGGVPRLGVFIPCRAPSNVGRQLWPSLGTGAACGRAWLAGVGLKVPGMGIRELV